MSQLLNSSEQLLSQLLPGPSRTLLYELCTGVCPVCVNSDHLSVCVCLTSGKAWEILPSGGSLAPKP